MHVHGSSDTRYTTAPKAQGYVPPRWYTPKRLLAYFCLITFLAWMDMGVFSSNAVSGNGSDDKPTGAKKHFGLSSLQLGSLAGLYSVGMLIASFIFSELAKYFNSYRLIGAGALTWAFGALLTGASNSFAMLAIARTLVGGGEAPLMTLTFCFVDDVAPPKRKSLWFGILAIFPMLGGAFGYVIAAPAIDGMGSWRDIFFVEAGVGALVSCWALFSPKVDLSAVRELGEMADVYTTTGVADAAMAGALTQQGGAGKADTHHGHQHQDHHHPHHAVVSHGIAHAPMPLSDTPAHAGEGDGGSSAPRLPTSYAIGIGAAGDGEGLPMDSEGAPGGWRGKAGKRGKQQQKWVGRRSGSGVAAVAGVLPLPLSQGKPANKVPLSEPLMDMSSGAVDSPLAAAAAYGSNGHLSVFVSHAAAGDGAMVVAASHPGGLASLGVGHDADARKALEDEYIAREGFLQGQLNSSSGDGSGGAFVSSGDPWVALPPSAGGNGGGVGSRGRKGSRWTPTYSFGGRLWRRRQARRLVAWWRGMMLDVRVFAHSPSCNFNNWGYAPIQWCLGIMTFWAPKIIKDLYHLENDGAELAIGIMASTTGIVGTILGGVLLDAMGATLANGFLLQFVSAVLALVFGMLTMMVSHSFTAFVGLGSVFLLNLFLSQAPSYAISMRTVPPAFRPASQAMIMILQHVVGDVPSPIVAGGLHSLTGEWRRSISISFSYLAFAVILFGAGWLHALSGRAIDYREGSAKVHEEWWQRQVAEVNATNDDEDDDDDGDVNDNDGGRTGEAEHDAESGRAKARVEPGFAGEMQQQGQGQGNRMAATISAPQSTPSGWSSSAAVADGGIALGPMGHVHG